MDYREWDPSNCSVGRAAAVVGQPWVLLILREVGQGIRRFTEMQDRLGVSRSVLSDRLDGLVAAGILELRDYREAGQRRRCEYHMTQKGRDLYPAITALREWGDKYLADPEGPAAEVLHRGCGAHVHARLVCDAGHELAPEDVERRPGPGARRRVAA